MLITENNSDIDSDSESEISVNDSGSNESFLSDFSDDKEMESSDNLTQVRNFCELGIGNPLLPQPRFPFTAQFQQLAHLNIDLGNGTQQFLDIFYNNNLLKLIVSETNKYTDRIIRNSNLRNEKQSKKMGTNI
ncbi:uncharacterized protein TNCV_641511 [Trichonephila clavipes]|nr:uncharacterized protein TNCV_641511 [Trichonephila clavipes]